MPEIQCGTVVYFDIRRFSAIDRRLDAGGVYKFLSDFHSRLLGGLSSTELLLYKVQSDTAVYWKPTLPDSILLDSLAKVRDELNTWFSGQGYSSLLAVAVVEGEFRSGTILAGSTAVFDLSGEAMGRLERIIHLQEKHPDPSVIDGFVVERTISDRLVKTDGYSTSRWYNYGVYTL